MLLAIRQFGFGSLDITAEDLLTPGRVIQLGHEPNRIDLISAISGVEFEEAWPTRIAAQMAGITVFVLGRDELIRNKRAAGRPKDLIDVTLLETGNDKPPQKSTGKPKSKRKPR